MCSDLSRCPAVGLVLSRTKEGVSKLPVVHFQVWVFRSVFSAVWISKWFEVYHQQALFVSSTGLNFFDEHCSYQKFWWLNSWNIAWICARWWLQTFCSTLLGEIIQFDLYFSGLGWNHHLDLRFTTGSFLGSKEWQKCGIFSPEGAWASMAGQPTPRAPYPPQKQGLTIRAYENHRVSP